MESIKIMSFLFLLAMTEGMPTEYSPKSTHPLGDIDWDTQIRVCGADLTYYMDNTVCKIPYVDDINEYSYSRTPDDFQNLATECCKNSCTSRNIKLFCVNNSTTPLAETSTADESEFIEYYSRPNC